MDDLAAFCPLADREGAEDGDASPRRRIAMRHMSLSAAAVALFLALGHPAAVSAQAVTCKDGTTASASGRGACSHHGGEKQPVYSGR